MRLFLVVVDTSQGPLRICIPMNSKNVRVSSESNDCFCEWNEEEASSVDEVGFNDGFLEINNKNYDLENKAK